METINDALIPTITEAEGERLREHLRAQNAQRS
jgi:hypothetical protein